jgi:hypothetical protein
LADSGRDAKRSPNKHGGHRGKSPQRDTIVKPSVESVKKVIKTKIASAPAPPKPTISPELNYDEDDYELNKLLGATSDSDLQPQYLTPREEVGAVAAGDDDVDDEAVRGNARTVEEDGELVGSGGDDEALVDGTPSRHTSVFVYVATPSFLPWDNSNFGDLVSLRHTSSHNARSWFLVSARLHVWTTKNQLTCFQRRIRNGQKNTMYGPPVCEQRKDRPTAVCALRSCARTMWQTGYNASCL